MRSHIATLMVAAVAITAPTATGQADAIDDLLMLGTTVPAEADRWYQSHYGDTLQPSFEIEFARVYAAPSENATVLGNLWTVAGWEPYLHLSWVFRPLGGESAVWLDDVGDWGYGINQFVLDTVSGWVQLPPGPYGDSGWVRVVSYDETNGFFGSVSSIRDQLVEIDGVSARRVDDGKLDSVSGVVLIESIESGVVVFRPEAPSDMPCEEEVGPDPEVLRYRASVSAFITDAKRPKFRLAYPKGC